MTEQVMWFFLAVATCLSVGGIVLSIINALRIDEMVMREAQRKAAAQRIASLKLKGRCACEAKKAGEHV